MHLPGRNSDLSRLVELCRKGDPDAWSILVDRFADYVYSVARRHRLSEDDAADVFQATFQALHANIDRIDQPETLPKWLAVTAARASLRHIRNSARTVPLITETHDLTEVLATEEASAEASAVRESEALSVRLAVESLGGKCAPLLRLLYLSEDSSYQQVSDQLGIPMGTIGPTRARCLEKLKRALEKEGFFS